MLDQRITERVQHRHRLRHRERQIKPGHPPRMRRQLHAVRRRPDVRRQPGQDGTQIGRRDLTRQSEPGDPATHPDARCLTRTRVVLLQPRRDLRQVIGLHTDPQLPQRHHTNTCLRNHDFVTPQHKILQVLHTCTLRVPVRRAAGAKSADRRLGARFSAHEDAFCAPTAECSVRSSPSRLIA